MNGTNYNAFSVELSDELNDKMCAIDWHAIDDDKINTKLGSLMADLSVAQTHMKSASGESQTLAVNTLILGMTFLATYTLGTSTQVSIGCAVGACVLHSLFHGFFVQMKAYAALRAATALVTCELTKVAKQYPKSG